MSANFTTAADLPAALPAPAPELAATGTTARHNSDTRRTQRTDPHRRSPVAVVVDPAVARCSAAAVRRIAGSADTGRWCDRSWRSGCRHAGCGCCCRGGSSAVAVVVAGRSGFSRSDFGHWVSDDDDWTGSAKEKGQEEGQ